MPGQKQRVPIRFPFKGVDQSAPLSAMPEGSCPDMLNMLPFGAQVAGTNVSRNRAVGVKRAGIIDAPTMADANRTVVGIYNWRTLYKPDAASPSSVDPINLLFVFTSGAKIAVCRPGTDSAFGAAFNVPGTSPVALTRPTFAPLGTNLFVVGPVKADRSANACYLSAYAVAAGGTGVPTSAIESAPGELAARPPSWCGPTDRKSVV
jgi:hypothetical protein